MSHDGGQKKLNEGLLYFFLLVFRNIGAVAVSVVYTKIARQRERFSSLFQLET